jgi:iron complex transport system substrate-binding protein
MALFLLIIPVGSANSDLEKSGGITITDDWGRSVTLDKPAERIVFGHEAAGEGILLAGGWDKVVGRDASLTNDWFYPNLGSLPAINPMNQPFNLDLEKVTELKPDLVILQKNYADRETFDSISEALEPDIVVVGLDFLDPESADSIKKLGILLGTGDVADEYVTFHDNLINGIKEKTAVLSEAEKQNVFIDAVGMGPDQISTYGKDASFWKKICDIAGGKNVGSELPSDFVRSVDLEWLLRQDIDTIVYQVWDKENPKSFGYMATDPDGAKQEADLILARIAKMDEYSHSDAVKNKDVHIQYWELANNPKSFIGVVYLAKWLHPDLVADIDPEQVHQEYLTKFIGTDLDLNDVGLFGYP